MFRAPSLRGGWRDSACGTHIFVLASQDYVTQITRCNQVKSLFGMGKNPDQGFQQQTCGDTTELSLTWERKAAIKGSASGPKLAAFVTSWADERSDTLSPQISVADCRGPWRTYGVPHPVPQGRLEGVCMRNPHLFTSSRLCDADHKMQSGTNGISAWEKPGQDFQQQTCGVIPRDFGFSLDSLIGSRPPCRNRCQATMAAAPLLQSH